MNDKEKTRKEIFPLMECDKYKEEIQIFSQQFEDLKQISRELNVDIKIFADPELTRECDHIVNSIYSCPAKVHLLQGDGNIFVLVPADVDKKEYGNKEKINILGDALVGLMEVAVMTLSEEHIKAYQEKVLKMQDSNELSAAITQLIARKNEIKGPKPQPEIEFEIAQIEEIIEEQKINLPISHQIEIPKAPIPSPDPIHEDPPKHSAPQNAEKYHPVNSNAFKIKSIQGSFINLNMHSLNSLVSLKNNPLYESVPLPYFDLNLPIVFPDQQALILPNSIDPPKLSSIKTFPLSSMRNWEEEKFN